MKRHLAILLFSITCAVAARPALADEKAMESSPWERYSANLGVFFATVDSNVRVGTTSVGADFDVEDTLGIGSGNNVFRIDASWRFTENRRHRIDFTWFSLNRSGSTTLGRDLDLDGTTFPQGATVSSSIELDIFKGAYSYSFIQDDRLDLAVSGGLYVAPMSIDVTATGGFSGSARQSATAPLPVIGLRADIAITPKWFLRSGFDVFYVSVDDYTGYLTDVRLAGEYKAFKNVGFGLGFETMHLQVEAEESTGVPGVDFDGKFEFDYAGIYAYTKVYFD